MGMVASWACKLMYLQPRETLKQGGEPLRCNTPVNMTLASRYEGANLDAWKLSCVVEVENGYRFMLRRLSLLNGQTQTVCSRHVLALLTTQTWNPLHLQCSGNEKALAAAPRA